jgi:hypothetical protein
MTRPEWEPRKGETAPAYAAFTRYISLPRDERTVLAAYRQATGRQDAANPPGHWTAWCSKNEWLARARAYDIEQQRQWRIRMEEDQQSSLRRGGSELTNVVADLARKPRRTQRRKQQARPRCAASRGARFPPESPTHTGSREPQRAPAWSADEFLNLVSQVRIVAGA